MTYSVLAQGDIQFFMRKNACANTIRVAWKKIQSRGRFGFGAKF